MGARRERLRTLAGVNVSQMAKSELQTTFKKVLNSRMHGLCFSAYERGQEPGETLTENQIRRRLEIIKPHTNWVRSFSCTEGNELIPQVAHELGMKTLVGAWLGEDKDKNDTEIANLIEAGKAGHVDIAAVGNEVLYRKDLTEEELLSYIYKVKEALPGILVGYVDAYYEFEDCPEITAACDVILANCYPFWEGCHLDYSLLYMKDMYNRALKAGNGKKVIITETGWPSLGETFHGAEPSEVNAMKYFIDTQRWSQEEDIEIFYFASFDEDWKVGAEGDVGAFWGLWDINEQLKYS